MLYGFRRFGFALKMLTVKSFCITSISCWNRTLSFTFLHLTFFPVFVHWCTWLGFVTCCDAVLYHHVMTSFTSLGMWLMWMGRRVQSKYFLSLLESTPEYCRKPPRWPCCSWLKSITAFDLELLDARVAAQNWSFWRLHIALLTHDDIGSDWTMCVCIIVRCLIIGC